MNSSPGVWFWLLLPPSWPPFPSGVEIRRCCPFITCQEAAQSQARVTGAGELQGKNHRWCLAFRLVLGPLIPPPRSHLLLRFHGSTISRRLASLRPGTTCGPCKGGAACAERSLSPLLRIAGFPHRVGLQNLEASG